MTRASAASHSPVVARRMVGTMALRGVSRKRRSGGYVNRALTRALRVCCPGKATLMATLDPLRQG
jgi:hypothetical protein